MKWQVMLTDPSWQIDNIINQLFEKTNNKIKVEFEKIKSVTYLIFNLDTELMKQIVLPEGVAVACLTPKTNNNTGFNNTFEIKNPVSSKEVYRAIGRRLSEIFYRKY